MSKILIILSLFAFISAETHVYSGESIQTAIDRAPVGETIIVHDGTYLENLLIEKDIILQSVNGANSTIIDGSLGRGLGSTIVIRPESGSAGKPMIEMNGFGIVNGSGTDIINKTITLPDGTNPEEKVGGGLFVYVNTPKVNNCQFLGNGDNSTDKGGAVFAVSDKEDSDFSTRDDYFDSDSLENAEGELDLSNNTFLGNDATQGNSVYIIGHSYEMTNLSSGYFDIYNDMLEGSSEYWIKGIGSDLDQSGGFGAEDAILDPVYVSPNGSDSDNTGLSWGSPFQTISYAISRVYANSLHPATIYLAGDRFSPASNESFPIVMIDYINLIGQGQESTILDANGTAGVIIFENVDAVNIELLSIISGTSIYGGGIYFDHSTAFLNNVKISGNSADWGGGISCGWSNPHLENVLITGNSATTETDGHGVGGHGGGICISFSPNFVLKNVVIIGNEAGSGGGISILYYTNPILINVTIADNYAYTIASELHSWSGSGPIIINSIIWNNISDNNQAVFIHPQATPVVHYTNIVGGWAGEGNINTNPLFLDPNNGDYSLINTYELTSPCLDAGTAYFSNGEVIVDIPADEYYGQAPDMGAFEWWPEINDGDGDGVPDDEDSDDNNPYQCSDNDGDGCDDCSTGSYNPENDGVDYDGDGLCNLGDDDDDNDGVIDLEDCAPLYEFASEFDCAGICGGDNSTYDNCCGTPPNEDCSDDCIVDELGTCCMVFDLDECGICNGDDNCNLSGDLTGDGLINILDVVALVNIIMGGAEPNDAGDVNGDGVLNVLDVVALVGIILEM